MVNLSIFLYLYHYHSVIFHLGHWLKPPNQVLCLPSSHLTHFHTIRRVILKYKLNHVTPQLKNPSRSFFFFFRNECLCIFIYFLATPCSMRDLSSLPRNEPRPSALRVWNLNHWTTSEVSRSS